MTEMAYTFTRNHKIVMKCKIPVINLHFIHFSNILIDTVVFELHMCTVWTTGTVNVVFWTEHPEHVLQGAKNVGGAVQSNIFMVTCAVRLITV